MNTFTPTKTLKLLSVLSCVLVLGLAAGAFALSYDVLRHFATENGISPTLVWIWPLILDGAIVVFSISALRASLYLESYRYAMFLVIAATATSIAFNALHAPSGIAPKVMAGIPPLALFLCFDLLVRQLRNEVMRSMSKCLPKLASKSSPRKKTTSKANRSSDVASPKKQKVALRRQEISALRGSNSSLSEIANTLGVSQKTVERDIAELKKVPLHRDI
jgi:hypothetical protein